MKRILTGDRTTGKLHIGHYVGSLQSRVALQNDYEEFILIADVQALTTHFNNPEMINESIYNVCMDNIAAGLDPEKVTFIQQSMIPSIAELTMFYSMLTTVNHLLINPTIKTEARSYGMGESEGEFTYDFSKLTYGFLGYPGSQSADITFCNADLVPVGEDQIPHMEFTRRLVRHFNEWDKVRNAVTDTNRITVKTPGNPDVCPLFKYHQTFNAGECENIASMCRGASIGCVACKKLMNTVLNNLLEPMRERRSKYENNRPLVKEIIQSGTAKANEIGNRNIAAIKEKMHVAL